MTPLHWLAHNNDKRAIKKLLACEGIEWQTYNSTDNMAIDVGGTTPSWQSVDTFLEHFAKLHDLPKKKQGHEHENQFDSLIHNFKMDGDETKEQKPRRPKIVSGDFEIKHDSVEASMEEVDFNENLPNKEIN